MEKITVSAKTYDEAVTKALIELQTTSENMDIEVIQEGTSGFLGVFGGKPYIIRAGIKSRETLERKKEGKSQTAVSPKKEKKEDTNPAPRPYNPSKPRAEEKPAAPGDDAREVLPKDSFLKESESTEASSKKEEPRKVYDRAVVDSQIVLAKEFLEKILSCMGIPAKFETEFNENENEIAVVVSSDKDMGVLIGKRGQTLDSLQYLTSLVVNKGNNPYLRVKIDTENYREKRKEKLEILAKNIAAKAKKTKKVVVLEPMNPYERRIIHSILQSDTMVTTRSEGEEPYRHIIVVPKNRQSGSRGGYRKKFSEKKDVERKDIEKKDTTL